ncbi:MAG: acetyl-CoA carboxylase biotin carboxyl carrier protein [Elusimicrobiota bacterium]
MTKRNGKEEEEMSPTSEKLDFYIQFMKEHNLDALEVADGDFKVKLVRKSEVPVMLSRQQVPSSRSAAPGAVAGAASSLPAGQQVKAPLAGVFYRSSSPQNPPFSKEGDTVSMDSTLCIIEAMKVMNEIKAGVSGKVIKILAENGKPVKSGQVIFIIE